MQRLRRWLLPAAAVLSIALNVVLLGLFWRQQAYVNRYLWGGATMRAIYGLVALGSEDPGGMVVQEMLDSMSTLPGFQQRIDNNDYWHIRQALRDASHVFTRARAEMEQNGEVSASTREQVAELSRRLERAQAHLHRVNELKKERYAFNHAAWRAMWHDAARELIGAR